MCHSVVASRHDGHPGASTATAQAGPRDRDAGSPLRPQGGPWVGLGSDTTGELVAFGEPTHPRERARLLDMGLEALAGYWAGDEVGDTDVRFLPRPVQVPRIPVRVASVYPHRSPLQRVARWDCWFPIGLDEPAQLVEQLAVVRDLRGGDVAGFDVVVRAVPGHHLAAWADAGATWWLIDRHPAPTVQALRAAIGNIPAG